MCHVQPAEKQQAKKNDMPNSGLLVLALSPPLPRYFTLSLLITTTTTTTTFHKSVGRPTMDNAPRRQDLVKIL